MSVSSASIEVVRMPELTIWRTARAMIDGHGAHAPVRAAERAAALLAEGDMTGCAAWKRILVAINELLRTKLNEGERVN